MTNPRGIFAALAAAVLFGAGTPFAKLLLGDVGPWLLAGLLYLGSGIGLSAVRLFARGDRARLGKGEWPWLLAAVLAGGVAGPVLLMYGLAQTTASTSSLLLNAEGVFTAVLAWVAFKENAGRRIVLGMAAIVCGAAVLSWPGGEVSASWPALAVLGACLCWAIDNNLTRKVSLSDPLQVAAVKGLAAGATNLALALALGASLPPPGSVAAAAAVGFFGYGLSLAAFVVALRELGAARTGAYFSTAPFVGAMVSVLLLGEAVTPRLLAAAALMGAGVWLHLTERHEHLHAHEALEHEHAHTHDEHHRHHGDDAPEGTHVHRHRHEALTHRHPHYPDAHHQHRHD
ncbi:DMT family transporter [Oleispirillum naphthae]|uniref:DMT family transporter n=1 Tax=Oleispirillum naphthae TaxID=2838853 RepID=UPI00308220BC